MTAYSEYTILGQKLMNAGMYTFLVCCMCSRGFQRVEVTGRLLHTYVLAGLPIFICFCSRTCFKNLQCIV